MLLLSLVMAALIGHRALSQLRATSRSSFALPAQRSPVRRSQQVSANSHSNAQQHGAFGSPLFRANSSATCASVRGSAPLWPACQPTLTPPTQWFRLHVSECLSAPYCQSNFNMHITGSGIRRSAGTQAAASLVRPSPCPSYLIGGRRPSCATLYEQTSAQAPGDAALSCCRLLRTQAVLLLLVLAIPSLPASAAVTFCPSGSSSAQECKASLVRAHAALCAVLSSEWHLSPVLSSVALQRRLQITVATCACQDVFC